MQPPNWYGLYGESWAGIISDESFAHPAKFARGLIRHIYQHLFDEGCLKPGDIILDPFGGVALGAWPALRMGLTWVGVELEQPFCDLGQGCDCTGISQADWVRFFGRWERARYLDGRHWCPECLANAKVVIERNGQLSMFDAPLSTSYVRNSGRIPYTEPHRYRGNIERWADIARNGASAVLLQGDSRYLMDVVREAGGIVSSPPYINSMSSPGSGIDWEKAKPSRWAENDEQCYSTNPANLGNMPAGDPGDGHGVDAVIGSPPYAGSDVSSDGQRGIGSGMYGGDNDKIASKRQQDRITSPDGYGATPGQLAAMPPGQVVDGLVSSPPWENSQEGASVAGPSSGMWKGYESRFRPRPGGKIYASSEEKYGYTDGQLGQESGPTFWSAARTIVSQCYHVLKPGAVAVWVVKRFVRDKKIVEFSQQWADLCQSCGFELLHWHRAMLVEDGGTQLGLMGNDERKVKKRYSFFRRLHAQKYPELEIQWEDVLCMRKVT